MRKAKSLVAIALMALVATSCSNDCDCDHSQIQSSNVIKFATSSQPSISTKAVNDPANLQDQKFVENTPVNIYLTENGTGTSLLPYGVSSVSGDYYKFIVNGTYTGTGSTANSQLLTPPSNYVFKYPSSAGVDVYALHPANTDVNVDKTTTSFSVKDDQTADADYINSDLITATVANQTKAVGTILLKFEHKLSKITVKLQADAANYPGIVLNNAVIKVNGDKTVALSHVANSDGSTTLTLGATSDPSAITIGEYDATNGTAGIIIPQTAQKNNKLIEVYLPANNATFSYTPENDEVFEAGKEYEYTLTLKAELLTLVSVEIKDWTTEQRTGDAVLD